MVAQGMVGMDIRGFDEGRASGGDPTDSGVGEATINIGTDERRMQVRAYNQWVSLLKGRDYPAVDDLNPATNLDFGAHGVLLDFTGGRVDDPAIRFLGRALRDECGLDHRIARISQVPARSLLSRLTDHYLQIIANQAPIGFEAEFISTRGHNTMYRGILMPFSSDGVTIDFVYGVINWKEMVGEVEQAQLHAELAAAALSTPAPKVDVPAQIWADGPSASMELPPADPLGSDRPAGGDMLADRLAVARESAASAQAADERSHAALLRALGQTHDFALAAGRDPAGTDALLAAAGLKRQTRAPLTPLLKLVFGADYDKARLAKFATVLAEAAHVGVGMGGLQTFLEERPGRVRIGRAMRHLPAAVPADVALRDRTALATLRLDVAARPGELLVLVARAGEGGAVDVLGAIDADPELTARAALAVA